MKFVLISDTHTLHDQIKMPEGDILIHAGDSTGRGSIPEIAMFNNWLGTLDYKHIVVISGNHDWAFQRQPTLARNLMTNAIYLEDQEVTIEGLRVYGSPHSPFFYNWAFNLHRGKEIKTKWDLIPAGIDVLVTHGPPHKVMDRVERDGGLNVGCEELALTVQRIKPKLHVFGHIHSGHGIQTIDGVTYVNASVCNEEYEPVQPPIVVDL